MSATTTDVGEVPDLNEHQVATVLSEALVAEFFELDVDGNLPREYAARKAAATELVRQARLSYAVGNRSNGVMALLFAAEVELSSPKSPELEPETGGEPVSADVDISKQPDASLQKFEETLLNYPNQTQEVLDNLKIVRDEMRRRGLRTSDEPETNGHSQPEVAQDEVHPEQSAGGVSAERKALEDRLTFSAMRAHGIDPSQINGLSDDELRWVVEHPAGDQTAESAPTPTPEAPPQQPQEEPQTIETTRMVVDQPSEPERSTSAQPESAQEVSNTVTPEREELEGQVTGPMLKCVAKGEQVLMADGSRKAIEDVRVGEVVLSSDGRTTQVDLVSDCWSAGVKAVIKVTLSDGRILRVTPDHRVFGWDEWTRAGELQINDPVCVPLSTEIVSGAETVSLDDAFLVSLWLAEGLKNLRKYQAFRYTSEMDEIHDRVEEIALKRGWSTTTYQRPIDRAITRGSNRARETSAVALLRRYGLQDVRVDTVFVPEAILRGSRDVVVEFLSTYIACDGCVKMGTQRGVEVTSASERICRDLQILAARLGVRSSVRYIGNPPSRRDYRSTWAWSVLGINGICKLAEELRIPGKQMLLDDLAEGLTDRRRHGGVIPPDFCDDLLVKQPRGFPQRESLDSWLTKEKAVALLELPKNQPIAEAMHVRLDGGLGWSRVVGIENDGTVETFDLETARHHAFFLEGGLTHNSYGRGRRDVPGIGTNELRFMVENPEGRVTQEQLLAARALDEVGGESERASSADPDGGSAADGKSPVDSAEQSATSGTPAPEAQEEAPVESQRVTKARAQSMEPPENPAQEVIDQEHFPVPPEIDEKPPHLPFDLSKCSDEEIASFHARFHACHSRANYVVGLWEGRLRDLVKLRKGREVEVANEAPKKDPEDSRKRLTDAQREAYVAADPTVVSYRDQEHEVERVLRQLRVLRDGYAADVSTCSRQWAIRKDESGAAGGLK